MATAEDLTRAAIALAVFLLMALWEWAAPRRAPMYGRALRWPGNLALGVLNAALVRLVMPMTVFGAAVFAESKAWGLLRVLPLPALVEAILTFVALDLVIYAQHRVFHRVDRLWRFHRVHHADLDFDVTTGLRFHPVEALISWCVKVSAVLVLGVPPLVVVAFEVVLNATSTFNHGNVRIPLVVDALLRTILVTPDMHRVHHSRHAHEMNSNFGFNFPWWDHLFSTYRAQPDDGHETMELGIDRFRAAPELRLSRMLSQPWQARD